jgi:hypothetical protein
MSIAKLERTAQEWFAEAERTYTEKHQGCPWCGGSHRVFCQRRGQTVIFYCQACDFQVSHDVDIDRFRVSPGIQDRGDVIPETMCGIAKTMHS